MHVMEWMTQAERLRARREPFALVTVLRVVAPTSARPGDKAVVTSEGQIYGWIGGGCAQPAVIKTVRQALRDGQPRHIRILPRADEPTVVTPGITEFGMACHSGGTLELFIEPMLPSARLLVIGDSPVARSLCALAPHVGFEVTLLAFGAQREDFPTAHHVWSDDAPESVHEAWGRGDFVVVATQGRRDLPGLLAALRVEPEHLWFVASARKGAALKAELLERGCDPSQVDRIEAPAGERIGAQTPEEVALAVLASVVSSRRRGRPAPIPCPSATLTEPVT
jgi:xanthine dehydrogenase accessory factor